MMKIIIFNRQSQSQIITFFFYSFILDLFRSNHYVDAQQFNNGRNNQYSNFGNNGFGNALGNGFGGGNNGFGGGNNEFGGQKMAWDLQGINYNSWGKNQWDSWFDDLELKLGFLDGGNNQSGKNNPNFDYNWPEWQNNGQGIPKVSDNGDRGNDDGFEAGKENTHQLFDSNGKKWPEMKGKIEGEGENDDFGELVKSYYLRRKKESTSSKEEPIIELIEETIRGPLD
jgi:hypothetical protein